VSQVEMMLRVRCHRSN